MAYINIRMGFESKICFLFFFGGGGGDDKFGPNNLALLAN